MNKFLDYSQWKSYNHCPMEWFEKYREQVRQAPTGQSADALTLGSLVHSGIQHFREKQATVIPVEAIDEFNPTPECLAWAQELLLGYTRHYANEAFTKYYCEEPLKFPLIDGMDGLAKVDCYFDVAEDVTIETGLGDTFTLEPGTWIHEYKTKAASKDIGKYIAAWRTNMQACFQMLALEHQLNRPVAGLIVNVLEKPQDYQPKRTCKTCKVASELRDWEPSGTQFACPACQAVQDIDTTVKSKINRVPKYYRIMVKRNRQELELAKTEMAQVATDILAIDAGSRIPSRNTEACIDQIFRPCVYSEPHGALRSAASWPGFIKVEALRYVTR